MKRNIIIAIFAIMLLSINLKAEENLTVSVIKSPVWCEMCDATLQKGLKKLPAVQEVLVDLEKQEVTVKYDESKSSLDKIRRAISKLGYDADDVPADKTAYKKLPNCCKKPEDRK